MKPLISSLSILICVFFLAFFSCSKDDDIKPDLPNSGNGSDSSFVDGDRIVIIVKGKKVVIGKDSVQADWGSYAKVFNEFREIEDPETVTQFGHVWSKDNPKPTFFSSDGRTNLGRKINVGQFESLLTELEANTKYYVRTYYATADGGLEHSPNILAFTTKPDGLVKLRDYPGNDATFGIATKDKIFVGSGNKMWSYTPGNNQWASVSGVPSVFANKNITAVSNDGVVFFSTGNQIWEFDVNKNQWKKTVDVQLNHGDDGKTKSLNFTYFDGKIAHARGFKIPPYGTIVWNPGVYCVDSITTFEYDIETKKLITNSNLADCLPKLGSVASNFFFHDYEFIKRAYVLDYSCELGNNVFLNILNDTPIFQNQEYTDFGGKIPLNDVSILCLFDRAYLAGGVMYSCEADVNSYDQIGGFIISRSLIDAAPATKKKWLFSDANAFNYAPSRSNVIAIRWNNRLFLGLGKNSQGFIKDWWELIP